MVEPVDKKRKVVENKESNGTKTIQTKKPSRIFSPFRVLGNVSNEIPFAIGSLGSTFYVVTSIGKTFQIYDVSTLHLLFVSQKQTSSKITALAAHYHYVYAAYGNKIGIYKRGLLQETLEIDISNDETITKLLIFGDFLICCSTSGQITIFKKGSNSKYPNELYSTLYAINCSIHDDIIGLIHPPTYLNKIVVATTSKIFIFNVKTGKLLFQSPENQFPNHISCIELAPVLDIVAVGLANGDVYLYNIKKGTILGDKIVTKSQDGNSNDSKVIALSFRTDGSSHLVAGLNNGDLFFYDLERRSRIHILRNAHRESHGGIANVKFLNGQSILVTNGGDNTLKEYVFDPSLSTSNSAVVSPPRHLRSRGGHSAPPVNIEFPQEDKSHFVLSASSDRSFWSFSLRKDAQSQEMSQRLPKSSSNKRQAGPVQSMREKFPEIIAIASNQAREGDWDTIITSHKDEPFARTWDSQNKRVGHHQLATVDGGMAGAVCISHCGNFAIVGSSKGGIASYNLQSGVRRKRYMLHKDKAVTGICIDGMNRHMVSCGLDGIVGFYDFTKLTYLGKLQLDAPITSMIYQKTSDLVACALDDLTIVVIDVITQRVVRILYGHSNRITGMSFSPDGRWIVSTSLDSTLRTWDLPTGGCIDGVQLPSVATSVKFSPIGDMLATTHVSGNGIFLWTNKAQFKSIGTRLIEDHEFSTILLPNASGDGGSNVIDGALGDDDDQDNDDDDDKHHPLFKDLGMKQLDESLVTLSLGSRSKYSTLMHLDVIKQRSKPTEAPKKPQKAPFFLSIGGEEVGDRAVVAEKGEQSDNTTNNGTTTDETSEDSKLLKFKSDGNYNFESDFTKLLRQGNINNDYSEFLACLVNLSPATTDLEVRSLNSFPPLTEMTNFVNALCQGISTNKNYDIYQAIFAMFLKNHGDVIYNNHQESQLHAALAQYDTINSTKKNTIDELSKYCSGVIDFLSSV